MIKLTGVLVSAALASAVLAGCGSERSVEAYCGTFYGEGGELRDRWSDAQGADPLTQAATLLQAPQEMKTFFDRLEKVAPDEIQPDVAAVRDSEVFSMDWRWRPACGAEAAGRRRARCVTA